MDDELIEGVDYYWENGFMVFTALYLQQARILLPVGLPALSVWVREGRRRYALSLSQSCTAT